jgi:type I restriction enzyme R subunit
MITEDQLEQLALHWFQEAGWDYLPGPGIAPDGPAPERADYRAIVLRGRLAAAVRRLNPRLPSAAVEEVVHLVAKPDHPSLIQSNHAFHKLLTDGVKIEFTNAKGHKETDHAQLIDFREPANNDFLVVNQFTIAGTKRARRPDLVLFVNGLPLAIVELKNPADLNADVWEAFGQLQTYKDEIEDLFVFNEALVVSDGMNARIGSLTASKEWFMPWRTIASAHDQPVLEFELEKVVRGFFRPDLFLDYVRNFVLFEQDGDTTIKKIAGYHQFHGVREAVAATLTAVTSGSGKAGVFWHTQGSGKSISMAMYAGKLMQQPAMNNPTNVVVTDRNDLDGQLFGQFCAAKDLLRETPLQADGREELRELLSARQSGGIIFTTVQKFSLLDGERDHPLLCDRKNVVVISDEAHRSQYGLKARLDTKTGQYVYGYAKHMRDALPAASFIGFTGTPIAKEDKDTRGVFGEYVSIYDIQDAVEDHATVQIYYESRLAKLDVNQAEIEKLNEDVEEVIEDEEDIAARENTKSKWAELAKLVGAKPRLEQVACDLVAHFETRTSSLEGKGMIVAMSRAICVDLFNEIIKLRPDWEGTKITKDGKAIGYNPEDGAIRIIMTGTASDKPHLQEHVFTKAQKKRLEKRFKDPADPLRLVIVRDMWLTGFDAPCCHTMYVDKPMHGYGLMQAIARVNRVFKDKPGGLVVDYIGIGAELKSALRMYTDAKGKGQPTVKAEDGLRILREKLDIVCGMMQGCDYSDYATDPLSLLLPVSEHLLGLPDGKKRFLDVMASITRAYSLCATLDEAAALQMEIAFFSAIRAVLVKHTSVDRKRTEESKNSTLKQILDNAILAEGVTDIFALAGMERPNIGLLSDEFLDDIRKMPQKNLAVELLERLLRDEIRSKTRGNVVQEKKFSERLLETIRKYHNRAIETKQVIEELISMAKDFNAAANRNEALGLAADEIAFYDALAERPEVLEQMGDVTLKKLALELTEKLRQSTTVDWQVRDSVRAQMRLLIKRLLRKYKYPPEGQEAAVQLVLEQAEALADAWSANTGHGQIAT